jgi:hypothetical protein
VNNVVEDEELDEKKVHYRLKAENEQSCLACEESESGDEEDDDGNIMLWCSIIHEQVDDKHCCDEISESQTSKFLRMQEKVKEDLNKSHQSELWDFDFM